MKFTITPLTGSPNVLVSSEVDVTLRPFNLSLEAGKEKESNIDELKYMIGDWDQEGTFAEIIARKDKGISHYVTVLNPAKAPKINLKEKDGGIPISAIKEAEFAGLEEEISPEVPETKPEPIKPSKKTAKKKD